MIFTFCNSGVMLVNASQKSFSTQILDKVSFLTKIFLLSVMSSGVLAPNSNEIKSVTANPEINKVHSVSKVPRPIWIINWTRNNSFLHSSIAIFLTYLNFALLAPKKCSRDVTVLGYTVSKRCIWIYVFY